VGVLILANPRDRTAREVERLLRARLPTDALTFATPQQLFGARRINHRVTGTDALTHWSLQNGAKIRSESLTGVLNRLDLVDLPAFARSSDGDRAYANAEMHALLVSWLSHLHCTVIDRPTPHALFGAAHSPFTWSALAARAGLSPERIRLTTSVRRFPAPGLVRQLSTLPLAESGNPALRAPATGPGCFSEEHGGQTASALVVGESVWVDGPDTLGPGARRLAREAGMTLLRVHFSSTSNGRGWQFTSAEVLPTVTHPDHIAALAHILVSPNARRATGRARQFAVRDDE
jgi:hypothetical protein